MDKAERAAMILCKLGETHLWHPRLDWALKLAPGINLYFRVGSGRQTCHVARGDAHSITIGVECVREILHSPKHASAWLSYDELKQYDYFANRLEPAELLVHTLCHEFAHFVQAVLGRREPGQQHDKVFYTILNRIHQRGHSDAILLEFKKQCVSAGLSLDYEDISSNLIYGRIGERVLARTADRIIAGRIMHTNKRSVTVRFRGNGVEHQIRISPCLLNPDTGIRHRAPKEWI